MRIRDLLRVILLLALGAGPSALAQSMDPDLAALHARLEVLERQNAELRASLLEQGGAVYPVRVQAEMDEAQLRAAYAQFKAEEEAKKKAAEEAQKAAGYEVGTDLGMTATWNNGLELSTKNKDFRVHVGGRSQFDVGWFSVDDNVQNNINIPYADGCDFRRARLRVDGTMYEQIEWAAEYDFINSARVRNQPISNTAPGFFDEALTGITDLWWQFKEVPWLGNIRIGNQKEPIGFEHLVSSRFLPFMERSYNQDSFHGGVFNGFTPGIQAFNTYGPDENGVWALGIFKPTNNIFAFNTGNGDYSLTGRLTYLLWYADEGRGLLHIGASGRQATAVGQAGIPGRLQVFRTRDALRTGLSVDWPVPAGITLYGDHRQAANGELVGVYGPWTFQSEYQAMTLQDARTSFAGASPGAILYHGGYVQLLYFLTGESDHYNKKTGFFERIKPNENFFFVRDADGCRCHGRGAWQVGARYNYLDLNNDGLNGGILHNATVGVNWFLNPNMKLQGNWIATYRDAPLAGNLGDGWIYGWGMRVAHDF